MSSHAQRRRMAALVRVVLSLGRWRAVIGPLCATLLLSLPASSFSAAPEWKWSKNFSGFITYHAAIVDDLNADGRQELVLGIGGGYTTEQIIVLDATGQMMPGWPIDPDPTSYERMETAAAIAVGDLDGDGMKEIVVATGVNGNGIVYAYDYRGAGLPGFPVVQPGQPIYDNLTLGDVDGDGRLDIVVAGNAPDAPTHIFARAYNYRGDAIRIWPTIGTSGGMAVSQPALGDVDGDCVNEVAFTNDTNGPGSQSWPYGGHALSASGNYLAGWPIESGYQTCMTPTTMADVDGDGFAEILTAGCSGGYYVNAVWQYFAHGPFMYSRTGQMLRYFPKPPDRSYGGTIVLVDLDGDRDLELVHASQYDGTVDAWHHDGTIVAGWPVQKPGYTAPAGSMSPVVGDIDGDGDLEILIGATVTTNTYPTVTYTARIYGWHHDGRPVDSFPLVLPNDRDGVYNGNITLADLDGDGLLDLIRVGFIPATCSGCTNGRTMISLFGTSARYSPSTVPWPMPHHDPARTNFVSTSRKCPASPVLSPIGNQAIEEGQQLGLTVRASDANNDQLAYSTSPLPSGASFDPATQAFAWTPSFTQAGSYAVTFTVTDPGQLSDSETITITVTNVNQAPVLAPIAAQSVAEGQPLSVTLSGSDPDGDALSYGVVDGLPLGAALNPGSGLFAWTPGYDQAGFYALTVSATDGSLTDLEPMAITVLNTNRPPELASIGAQLGAEDESLSFTVSATDPDGDALSFAAASLPAGATFDAAAQLFSWTPTFEQAGSYTVTISVSDGTLSASEEVVLTIANTNRPPKLVPIGPQSLAEAQPFSLTIQAADPDGEAVSYLTGPLPAGASFDPATATFSWTPTYDQAGTYVISFLAVDPEQLADVEDVTFTVANTNRPPEWEPIDDAVVPEGGVYRKTVSATDHDGEPLTYAANPILPNAAFDAFTRTFEWTPGYDQAGNYTVTFTVSDPNGASQAKPVLFTVTNTNRSPGFDGLSNATITAGQTLTLILRGSDPDGDALRFSSGPLPKGATFNAATATFSWTPTSRQVGQYAVTFTISDGTLSASQTITITVLKPVRTRK